MYLIWTGAPTADHVWECIRQGVNIRTVRKEDSIADVVVVAGPELTVGVVWTDDDMTVLGDAQRRLVWQIRRGKVSSSESYWLPLAQFVVSLMAERWDGGSRSLRTHARTHRMVLDKVVRICGAQTEVHISVVLKHSIGISASKRIRPEDVIHGEAYKTVNIHAIIVSHYRGCG